MPTKKYIPAAEAREQGSVENLLAVWNQTPEDVRQSGERWYLDAQNAICDIARRHGKSRQAIAAAVAILSPSLSWEDNLRAVEVLLDGRKPQGYGRNVEKARLALAGAPPEMVVTGFKVRAFYDNILWPGEAEVAVVDRHMLRAWLGRTDERGSFACSPALTRQAADHIKAGARRVGYSISAFQAAVWLQVRKETTNDQPA